MADVISRERGIDLDERNLTQLFVHGGPNVIEEAIHEARLLADVRDAMTQLGNIAVACHGALPMWNRSFPAAAAHNLAADAIGYIQCFTGGEAYVNEQIRSEIGRLERSNLLGICRTNLAGDLNSPVWHDFGDGLAPALNRGVCGNTMNPLLVWEAIQRAEKYWAEQLAGFWESDRKASAQQIGNQMTIAVVKVHADLVRPIYDITNGRLGYVSLQLDPTRAHDRESMLQQAVTVAAILGELGIINVIFKVPGTSAGLDVVGEIMATTGMGVNVTVNYMLAQQLAFGEAIESLGLDIPSCLTQMNGRLASAVIEDLESKLGAGSFDPVAVQMWSMHAVRQAAYHELYLNRGYTHSQPLGAAGRGPWDIDLSLNNGPVPTVMTVFPPRQDEYDAEPRNIRADGLWTPIPNDAEELMLRSDVYRLAIDPGASPVTYDTFPATVATLRQFGEKYDAFLDWVDKNRPAA